MPGPRGWECRQGVGSLWPLGGPLGGAASALYTVGDTLSLLQEINSQRHKARGAGLSEVSKSGDGPGCVPGKGSRSQAGFLFTCIFGRFPRPEAIPNSD